MTKTKLKGAAKSRTMWLAGALAVAGVVQVNLEVFQAFLTPQAQGMLTLAVGIAVAVLRTVTSSSLDEKGGDQ